MVRNELRVIADAVAQNTHRERQADPTRRRRLGAIPKARHPSLPDGQDIVGNDFDDQRTNVRPRVPRDTWDASAASQTSGSRTSGRTASGGRTKRRSPCPGRFTPSVGGLVAAGRARCSCRRSGRRSDGGPLRLHGGRGRGGRSRLRHDGSAGSKRHGGGRSSHQEKSEFFHTAVSSERNPPARVSPLRVSRQGVLSALHFFLARN